MTSFILRKLDPDFWARVRAKAATEGVSVKDLILRLLASWLAAALLVTLSAGCGYHTPTEPTTIAVVPSSAPASIRLGVSSMTTSTYGITATVLTRDGHFVPGVLVTFAMDSGAVSPVEGTTNANGVVQAVATPSTTAATLTVSAGGSLATTTPIAAAAPAITAPPSTPSPSPTPPVGSILSVTLLASTVTVGTPTQLSAQVAGTAQRYAWTFGDGATSDGSSAVAHTYAASGSYLVSLVVTNEAGRTASANTMAVVREMPAAPHAPAPAALAASMTCTLAAHASATVCNVAATYGGADVPSTAITRVDWDFGNGVSQITAGPVISYPYPQAGTYLIVASVDAKVILNGAFVLKTTSTSKSVVIQ